MGGRKSKRHENAFYKHWYNFHETPNEDENLRMKNYEFRVEKFFKEPMSRQINEMVRITNFQGTLLNSKSEWNAPPIVRIIAENESDRKSREYASGRLHSVQPTTLNGKV